MLLRTDEDPPIPTPPGEDPPPPVQEPPDKPVTEPDAPVREPGSQPPQRMGRFDLAAIIERRHELSHSVGSGNRFCCET